MTRKHFFQSEELYNYYQHISSSSCADPLQELVMETKELGSISQMLTPPEQLQFYTFLIKLTQPKKILEIGTFTGVTAAHFALNSSPETQIITCDINEDWVSIGKKYWKRLRLENKITSIIGPALDFMKLSPEKSVDFILIDADKSAYQAYLEEAYRLCSDPGIILIDNTLWHGKLIEETDQSKRTKALREFNERLRDDKRFVMSVLPIGDGLTLLKKSTQKTSA